MKYHLGRVVGDVKLTYEELHTVLTEVEACLNSRPLLALPHAKDRLEVLTPRHFLIAASIKAVPDGTESDRRMPLLRLWSLCQALTQHLRSRWSAEYVDQLNKFSKWPHSSHNVQVGEIVCLKGE